VNRDKRIALIIVGLYLVLGSLYSVVVPVFEASDELSHYPYIKHLADGGGLPVQRPGEVTLYEQEGGQPPLYYALGAALTFWINTDDLPTVRHLNPHARIGLANARDNKNLVIHPPRSEWPWQGTVLAVHLLRFFSLLLGAGTVWCTYLLGRLLAPQEPRLALGAMALNAFNPMFLFINASVNNDNLVALLCAVTLLFLGRVLAQPLVRVAREGVTWRRVAGLGVLIGLACLTKLSALGLLPLAAMALAVPRLRRVWPRRRERGVWTHALRAWLRDGLGVALGVALVAGWWYARNFQLYGDPTGLAPFLDIVGHRQEALTLRGLLGEFEGFRISFWGLFGAVNVLMRPLRAYAVLDVLSVLALLGLLWRGWRTRHSAECLTLSLPALWAGIVLASVIRWTLLTTASQGRLMFSAMSALCVLLAAGLAAWTPRRGRVGLLEGTVVLLVALAAASPFVAIRPAYARPPLLSATDLPATATPYSVTYGGVMRLLAYEVDRPTVRPGEEVAVTLYWQALAPMARDYSIYVQLFGWRDEPLGQRDSYHGGGSYPSSFWAAGEVRRETLWVAVRADASGPVAMRLDVGLYDLATLERLRATDARGQRVGRPYLTLLKLSVPTPPRVPAQARVADVEQRARLLGYDLREGALRAGAEVPLTLIWQVTGAFDRDYTVFIHLVDSQGQVVGQGDAPPLEGFYPTSLWGAGETLADTHILRIRAEAQPGPHRLLVGFYHLASGQRLAIFDAQGHPSGDAIPLAEVTLRP
jgi:hypothetical protein